jgi:solute:Na+ symporter, SSS family
VMSIAAANLFTRNIYTQYLKRDATDHEQTQAARIASLVVKAGALAFVLFLPTKDAIDLQLLGGVWIIQTLPALVIGLFTRWFDRRALLVGWAVAMVVGTLIARHQGYTPTYEFAGITAYTALWALLLNLVISGVLTLVMRAAGAADDTDETTAADYDELVDTGRAPPIAEAPVG